MATVGGSGWVTVGESGGWVVGASVSHTLEPKPFRAQATLFCNSRMTTNPLQVKTTKKQTNKSKTLSQGMEMMKKASSDDEATFSTESPFSFSDFPKPFE